MAIETLSGQISTPAFLPDATYGTVKALSFRDVKQTGVNEIVTTTLHLEQKLGSKYVKSRGGLHKFLNWDRPILTDSGGFQVFSLVHRRRNKANRITDAGVSFLDPATGKYSLLTPESSQMIQHNLDSDIRVVLDEPINHEDGPAQAAKAVQRTTKWAKRSKEKFLELNGLTEADFNNPEIKRPLLVGVIQGGNDFELRRRSAEELQEIGFDIYGFGGLPLHKEVTWKEGGPEGFFHELVEYVGSLVTDGKPRYGLGIGTPDDLVFCSEQGWDLFDTVLPTRNARHGYIYVPSGVGDQEFKHFSVMHIRSSRYKEDDNPIMPNDESDLGVSRAYLRHLIRINDAAGHRLASMHNLWFYSKLMRDLRGRLANIS